MTNQYYRDLTPEQRNPVDDQLKSKFTKMHFPGEAAFYGFFGAGFLALLLLLLSGLEPESHKGFVNGTGIVGAFCGYVYYKMRWRAYEKASEEYAEILWRASRQGIE